MVFALYVDGQHVSSWSNMFQINRQSKYAQHIDFGSIPEFSEFVPAVLHTVICVPALTGLFGPFKKVSKGFRGFLKKLFIGKFVPKIDRKLSEKQVKKVFKKTLTLLPKTKNSK